ncbi:MAG: hypothetical protein ACRD2N_21720 [Vicinamibacterales bacterium]
MNPPGAAPRVLTRTRKLAFAALTTVLALVVIEGAARVYSAVRFRNSQALTYGVRFLGHALEGSATPPRAATTDLPGEQAGDELFDHRANPDLVLASRPPMDVMIDGHPAHFNNLGLRGRDIDVADPTQRRIALFGGSDTFGAYLEDDETWAHLLESRLQAAGLPVEVLNAAANGHTINDVLRSVIELTHSVKVQYLVVTSAYNNRHLLAMERRYTFARRADWYLYNLSVFHVMLKEKLALMQRHPIDYGLYRQRIRVDAAAVASWIGMYRRRLEQMATVSREQHATLILCTQGGVFQDARLNALSTLDDSEVNAIGQRIDRGEEVWLSELEYFMQGTQNLALQQFARASPGVLFFDGAGVLHSDKARYFLDPVHPGPHGAAKLADALVAFFVPLLKGVQTLAG